VQETTAARTSLLPSRNAERGRLGHRFPDAVFDQCLAQSLELERLGQEPIHPYGKTAFQLVCHCARGESDDRHACPFPSRFLISTRRGEPSMTGICTSISTMSKQRSAHSRRPVHRQPQRNVATGAAREKRLATSWLIGDPRPTVPDRHAVMGCGRRSAYAGDQARKNVRSHCPDLFQNRAMQSRSSRPRTGLIR